MSSKGKSTSVQNSTVPNNAASKHRMPPHRKVIQDAAHLYHNELEPASESSKNSGAQDDDYETAKVAKPKKRNADADKQAVMDLDRWLMSKNPSAVIDTGYESM